VCCSALQCVLQCLLECHPTSIGSVAVSFNVLQCVAVCCSVLQCVAVRCSVLQSAIPPDPIHHVCSLTGKYIPENYFTYRPVQIFKILFPEIKFSRI